MPRPVSWPQVREVLLRAEAMASWPKKLVARPATTARSWIAILRQPSFLGSLVISVLSQGIAPLTISTRRSEAIDIARTTDTARYRVSSGLDAAITDLLQENGFAVCRIGYTRAPFHSSLRAATARMLPTGP